MANECTFCGQRHIETNMLVLNGGNMWVEFCASCGDTNVLRNAENGEVLLVRELWARCAADKAGAPFVRNAADIAYAAEIARQEDARHAERAAIESYHDEVAQYADADHIDRAILSRDHWDNLVYRCEHSSRYTAPRFIYAA